MQWLFWRSFSCILPRCVGSLSGPSPILCWCLLLPRTRWSESEAEGVSWHPPPTLALTRTKVLVDWMHRPCSLRWEPRLQLGSLGLQKAAMGSHLLVYRGPYLATIPHSYLCIGHTWRRSLPPLLLGRRHEQQGSLGGLAALWAGSYDCNILTYEWPSTR